MECQMNVETVRKMLKQSNKLTPEMEAYIDAAQKDTENQKNTCAMRFEKGDKVMCELKESVDVVQEKVGKIEKAQVVTDTKVDGLVNAVDEVKKIIVKLADRKSWIEHLKDSNILLGGFVIVAVTLIIAVSSIITGRSPQEWKNAIPANITLDGQ